MSVHAAIVQSPRETSFWKNKPGYKPILFIIAAVVFTAIVVLPPPQSMIDMVTQISPPGYKLDRGCTTIVEAVNKKLRPKAFSAIKQEKSVSSAEGEESLMDAKEVAGIAKIMIAILFLAAFLWGTEALPLGATDILVGVLIYLFAILPINEISQAYMKDAVFFIFGILAVAVGVAKTGLWPFSFCWVSVLRPITAARVLRPPADATPLWSDT